MECALGVARLLRSQRDAECLGFMQDGASTQASGCRRTAWHVHVQYMYAMRVGLTPSLGTRQVGTHHHSKHLTLLGRDEPCLTSKPREGRKPWIRDPERHKEEQKSERVITSRLVNLES